MIEKTKTKSWKKSVLHEINAQQPPLRCIHKKVKSRIYGLTLFEVSVYIQNL